MRRTAKYTLMDCVRNEDVLKELKTEPNMKPPSHVVVSC
jgi:hypothetical protein